MRRLWVASTLVVVTLVVAGALLSLRGGNQSPGVTRALVPGEFEASECLGEMVRALEDFSVAFSRADAVRLNELLADGGDLSFATIRLDSRQRLTVGSGAEIQAMDEAGLRVVIEGSQGARWSISYRGHTGGPGDPEGGRAVPREEDGQLLLAGMLIWEATGGFARVSAGAQRLEGIGKLSYRCGDGKFGRVLLGTHRVIQE